MNKYTIKWVDECNLVPYGFPAITHLARKLVLILYIFMQKVDHLDFTQTETLFLLLPMFLYTLRGICLGVLLLSWT